MARVLVVLIAVVLPVLVYLLWMAFERKRLQALVRDPGGWARLPWAWLTLSSIGLIILSFLAMWAFDLDPDGWIGAPSLIQRNQTGS